jgi:hypothetical protein
MEPGANMNAVEEKVFYPCPKSNSESPDVHLVTRELYQRNYPSSRLEYTLGLKCYREKNKKNDGIRWKEEFQAGLLPIP